MSKSGGVAVVIRLGNQRVGSRMRCGVIAISWIVLLLGAMVTPAHAMPTPGTATTIDFDFLAVGEALVARQGASFHNAVEGVRCNRNPVVRQGSNCRQARSGDIAVRTLSRSDFSRYVIDVEFDGPKDYVTAYVRFDGSAALDGKEVTVVMNGFDEDDNFIGSTTRTFIHNFDDGAWHEVKLEKRLPLCILPKFICTDPKQIKRVEIWGGTTEVVGSPPEKNRASNFLLLDDLTYGLSTSAPPDEEDPRYVLYLPIIFKQ